MHLDYDDIIKRLGRPLWHDSQGVPRYEAFTPHMATVYADHVALMEIECQCCGVKMIVASCVSQRVANGRHTTREPELPTTRHVSVWHCIGDFHYGDPPRHDFEDGRACIAGPTMNSIPLRVIEFWSRGDARGWERLSEFEVQMPPDKDE